MRVCSGACLQENSSPQLRILRLKHYIDADANCLTIDTVLDALEQCTQVEALYIHNFEEGMRDAQLAHLTRVLKKGHIWALNIGENFKLSAQAWNTFAEELPCGCKTFCGQSLSNSFVSE